MKAQLFAELEKKIQAWMDENCESTEWPDVYVGDRTVDHMATAARSVFDACAESQQYAQREGYLKSA